MPADDFFQGSLKRKRGTGGDRGFREKKAFPNGVEARKTSWIGKAGTDLPSVRGSRGETRRKPIGRENRVRDRDEELAGSGSESGQSDQEGAAMNSDDYDSEAEANMRETPAQKRLRLARMYLDSLKSGTEEGVDAAELEREIIAQRLQNDVLELSGKLHNRVADKLSLSTARIATTSSKVHRLSVTCAVARDDCSQIFTASKDGSVARYDVSSFTSPCQPEASTSDHTIKPIIIKLDYVPKRPSHSSKAKGKSKASESKGKPVIKKNQPSQDQDTLGHTDEIYTLALSNDGKRLASGGKDRRIGIWDTSNRTAGVGCRWIQGLRGHKDTIASIQFRLNTSQLYTSAFDRTVKIYDAASLLYIETLFGHQDKIYDIAVLKQELAVTAGGRDKTLRYWKIKDESQLVFRAGTVSRIRRVLEGGIEDADEDETGGQGTNGKHDEKRYVEGSVDCTTMVDDQHFLSGGDSGAISLWTISKKKPIFTHALAHGINEYESETEGIIGNSRWIVSLASLPYSDLFASGSWDGQIRLWKISVDLRTFALLGSLEAIGYVNSLQLLQFPASKLTASRKANDTVSVGEKREKVLIVAALGQEHKFGRWKRLEAAKNVAMAAVVEHRMA